MPLHRAQVQPEAFLRLLILWQLQADALYKLQQTSVTITALPVATFSYTGSPYCQNAANPSPTFSGGGAAGSFSSQWALYL